MKPTSFKAERATAAEAAASLERMIDRRTLHLPAVNQKYKADLAVLVEAAERVTELQAWGKQVHDAIDGRPLPEHPDATPARIAVAVEAAEELEDVKYGREQASLTAQAMAKRANEAEAREREAAEERDRLRKALHEECRPEIGECYAPQPLIDILGPGRCARVTPLGVDPYEFNESDE